MPERLFPCPTAGPPRGCPLNPEPNTVISSNVNPIPDGYNSVNISLTIKDAAKALDFYKEAFGAELLYSLPAPDGKVMHAEIRIGNTNVMVSDEFPEWGALSPSSLNGSPTTLVLYVPDVDAAHAQAVAAGATDTMPPADQFWGDRMGSVLDPFGHKWSIATHIEEVTPEQMKERAEEWLKSGAGCG